MKKIILFSLILLLNSCTTHKLYSELVDSDNKISFKNPLIVIPTGHIVDYSSNKLKRKLYGNLLEKNINSTIHLVEMKPDELKLNEKESFIDELKPIYEKNENDIIILFKYKEYHYGNGITFLQDIFVVDVEKEKVIWVGKGYSNFGAINKYSLLIINKLISDKVLSSK